MAPVGGLKLFFVASSETEWATRRKGMRKWMKDVKRSFAVEHVALEGLATLRAAPGDALCLFATSCELELDDIAMLTQLVEERGVGMMVLCGAAKAAAWNRLLGRFGIGLDTHAVMNVAPHPHAHHPRCVYLKEPVLAALPDVEPLSGLVLPYVASLKIERPAQAFLSSDRLCFPSETPLGAVSGQRGRVAVLACEEIAGDKWYDTVSNASLLKQLLEWLASGGELRRDVQPTTRRLASPKTRPDLLSLAEKPRFCAQFEDTPRLEFCSTLFAFSLERCSRVAELKRSLGLPSSKLSIIAPQFLTPTPYLRPAVFPIAAPEVPPPPLELFDLDAEFRDKRRQLDAAFQKSDRVVGFLEQAGQICGVRGNRPVETLFNVFQQLAQYKQ